MESGWRKLVESPQLPVVLSRQPLGVRIKTGYLGVSTQSQLSMNRSRERLDRYMAALLKKNKKLLHKSSFSKYYIHMSKSTVMVNDLVQLNFQFSFISVSEVS